MMMPLTEIEFELPAIQYELMGFPGLQQGQPLSLMLDAGVLLPEPSADGWFAVQKERLPLSFVHIGHASYAFTGQITEADLTKEGSGPDAEETATVLVNCGDAVLRVTCAPMTTGQLPFGTWETRYLTGYSRIQGIVEDDFSSPIGQPVGVTIWNLRRLVLTPGDPLFGQWHETDSLPPTPYTYDRILIRARIHRNQL